MPATPTVLPDAAAVGDAVADIVADALVAAAGRPFLLGCPSGRSLESTYRALARRVADRRIDLADLVVVLMDEYLTAGPDGLHRLDPGRSHSCVGYGRREIVQPLAAAAGSVGLRGPADLWVPDPGAPDEYDARITAAGGLDLFLLASGASDGHIALNQPGTPRTSRTHVVELGEATRRDNMATFPDLTTLDAVPTHGVTVGVSTIVDLSRSVVMVLTGPDKATAYARIVAADGYDPAWPSTAFAECADAQLFADRAAAGGPQTGR
ncbi:6-phosphogluconolactonase [Cellulomonas citrea]|uniref:6-phosphogluconolactonase n=1 Tax=Cellulomonas citrea TaxID=1909423 RepID=UPI00135A93EB|nr:6-phosphogluconolactonase [Cellulomonas citrea]